MKTVWILTWEFAGQGKYGKLISGVFANKKDAIDELESLTLPTDESGGFPFQRVPLEKIKAYILSVGV